VFVVLPITRSVVTMLVIVSSSIEVTMIILHWEATCWVDRSTCGALNQYNGHCL